jgi:glyoxylate/hydroxypyruvate/2-ketogluconate reductase
MSKPAVLVARAIFPEVLSKLREHFDVTDNQADEVLAADALAHLANGKWGLLTTGSERIDATLLQAAPSVRMVANMAVGYNNFDVPACTAAGVQCSNTPDVLTQTTADFGFALLMATARRLTESEHFLRAGQWDKWAYDMFMGCDVFGSRLGILGMGRIGQAIAARASKGFDMTVTYHNRSQLKPEQEAACGARYVSKHDLFANNDHVMVVVPYSEQTHHIVGAAELALMPPTATLVNIARGGVVDEAALIDALDHGRLAGAGLDVFEGEPRVNPGLTALSKVVLTPHIASASRATRLAMANLAADNLIAFHHSAQALTPVNVPHQASSRGGSA